MRSVVLLGLFLILKLPAHATNPGVSTMEQPINLCTQSDPTRIPLGKVAVWANYDYGIHGMIDAPRACPDGVMEWSGGVELNQNLASVFGVQVEPGDSTMILHEQNVLRVKNWKTPAYSPYTKEQVLAATLWCLIRNSGSSEKRPLDIKVVVEDQEDEALVKKYSGKYFYKRDEKGKILEAPKVPGTKLELDPMGFTWVVFPEVDAVKNFKPNHPVMIPMAVGEGDGGGAEEMGGDAGWVLAPVWGNGERKEPLKLTLWAHNMLYSCYQVKGIRDANAFHAPQAVHGMWVGREDDGTQVRYLFSLVDTPLFVANVWGLIMSLQPTEDKPLKISLRYGKELPESYAKLAKLADWKVEVKEGPAGGTYVTAEFVWDANTRKLTRGNLPWMEVTPDGWICGKEQ